MIGLPNATRSRAYSVACSNAARAMPTAAAATCGRECSKKSIASRNPCAVFAEEPVGRQPRPVQHDRAGVRRPQAELVLDAPGATLPGSPCLDEEGGRRAVELREDDGQLGDAAVRDVALLAVEDVRVAVPPGRRLDAGDVRARGRLGERDRREAALLRREPRQPPLAAAPRCRTRGAGRTGNIVAPIVAASPAQPHESSSAMTVDVTADDAAAAVGRRDRVRREAERAPPSRAARPGTPPSVRLGSDRAQLALGERAGERLELALLVREREPDARHARS